MKKAKAWILIIICSILLLMFIITFIAIVPGTLSGKNASMTTMEIISTTIGFVVVLGLLILGLKIGIKKIIPKRKREVLIFEDSLELEFNGQIKYSDYRYLMLKLSYNKPIYLLLFGILILFCLSLFENAQETNQINNYLPLIAIAGLILSFFVILKQIKKTYYSTKILYEKLNYKINKHSIQIKGSTVETIIYWNHFQKITETSNFIILYQSESLATLLVKKMFTQNELSKFNRFLSSLEISQNND